MRPPILLVVCCCLAGLPNASEADDSARLRVLIVDGQNNHDWQTTTPLLKAMLQQSGRFSAEVATAPGPDKDASSFRPPFDAYDVVVSNYNGERWPEAVESDFDAYVRSGGGFVSVHAANNAFPEWQAYNEMIGLGGWGGRNEQSGPYVYVANDGQLKRDVTEGRGGSHGPQHEFRVEARRPNHPILKGLPNVWMHAKDELYDRLRGPAKNFEVLATAYSSRDKKGTGRREPMLMAVEYGKGRVFHTALGHADYSMNCVGFITTLLRGTEWAATGKVTIPVPEDFPTADQSSSR